MRQQWVSRCPVQVRVNEVVFWWAARSFCGTVPSQSGEQEQADLELSNIGRDSLTLEGFVCLAVLRAPART